MDRSGQRNRLPVGVERVLFAAAVDADFRRALLEDPGRATQARGLELRPAELAMLRSIPSAQLAASIQAMDTSAENVERRSFLRTVAVAAAGVVVVEGLSACSSAGETGARPDWPDSQPPDTGQGQDQAVADTGSVDAGVLDDVSQAGTGIRP